MSCYRHEYYTFPRGKFDDIVDCTYIMTMENSPRTKTILETFTKYTPTSKCIIQYNKGYKNCKKNLKQQLPNHDLVHSIQNVFKHAIKSGCQRILVLEDDCMFDERINDPEIINDISKFINNNDPKIYSLGTLFHLTFPWEPIVSNHHRLIWGTCAHAMIYNLKYMIETCDIDFLGSGTDVEINRHWDKFVYYKPIAYQTFPDTENSRTGWIIPGLKSILDLLFFIPTGLTHKPQPGFDILTIIFQILSVLLFAVIFIFAFIKK